MINRTISKLTFSFWKHFAAILAVVVAWLPIGKWYFLHKPSLGVDFYVMASFVAHFVRNPALRAFSWKDEWYAGLPMFYDYPTMHMQLAVPFAKIFGNFEGTQLYLLFTTIVFLAFSYFVFWELSRNRLLSLILAVLVGWSLNFYGALLYGGNAATFANQAFLPIICYFLIRYLKTQDRRLLVFSGLLLGLSFSGHPGISTFFIVPISSILIFFWSDERIKIFSFGKIGDIFIYGLIALFAGSGVIVRYFSSIFAAFYAVEPVAQVKGLSSFFIQRAFGNTDSLLIFLTIGMFLAWLVFYVSNIRQSRTWRLVLPFLVVLIYTAIFPYLPVAWGGAWRAFWPLPFTLAMFGAICFSELRGIKFFQYFQKFKALIQSAIIFSFTIYLIFSFPQLFEKLENKFDPRTDYVNVLRAWGKNSRDSAAYPPLVASRATKEMILSDVLPAWLDPHETQYRFYTMNPLVNIWWNTYFPMPSARGYGAGVTHPQYENWLYWADTAISKDDIVTLHEVPKEIAKNYALFNIDWLAIKYLEGASVEETRLENSFGLISPEYISPLSSYVSYGNIFEKDEYKERLHFFQVKDELVSPIVRPTNASTILVISDEIGYDLIFKNIALHNLNSKYVIPIRGSQYIDDFKKEELQGFDALILYNFRYHNKDQAYEKLENYIKEGGRVFIDTGSEVAESDSENLPDFFPVRKSKRVFIGEHWDFEIPESSLTKDISFEDFSPPEYNGGAWKISYASEEGVRDWARTILKNQNYPVVVAGDYGAGKVIWSGLNIPYHILYNNNLKEGLFFKNILGELISLDKGQVISFEMKRPSSEKMIVKSNIPARGVLFKENYYSGWSSKLNSSEINSKLKIYPAGPDFMYVRLPENINGEYQLKFVFRGDFISWGFLLLSLLPFIFFIDYITGKKLTLFFGKRLPFWRVTKTKVGSWWDKDEE